TAAHPPDAGACGQQQGGGGPPARAGREDDPQQVELVREGHPDMKVATKLGGAFGVQGAILVGVLVYHVGVTREAVSTSYELCDISSRVFAGTAEQLGRIAQLDENASKYVVTRDRGYLEKFRQILGEFDVALLRLESTALSERESARFAALLEEWERFRPLAERLPAFAQAAAPDSLSLLERHL